MTDLKAWYVRHQPERRYDGRRVKCHAGAPGASCEHGTRVHGGCACGAFPALFEMGHAARSPCCPRSPPTRATPPLLLLLRHKATWQPPCFCSPRTGFYRAWLSGGFNRRVLDRLREIDDLTEGPLRFWVTGESLLGCMVVSARAGLSGPVVHQWLPAVAPPSWLGASQ